MFFSRFSIKNEIIALFWDDVLKLFMTTFFHNLKDIFPPYSEGEHLKAKTDDRRRKTDIGKSL